jgi:hypothetical protein
MSKFDIFNRINFTFFDAAVADKLIMWQSGIPALFAESVAGPELLSLNGDRTGNATLCRSSSGSEVFSDRLLTRFQRKMNISKLVLNGRSIKICHVIQDD